MSIPDPNSHPSPDSQHGLSNPNGNAKVDDDAKTSVRGDDSTQCESGDGNTDKAEELDRSSSEAGVPDGLEGSDEGLGDGAVTPVVLGPGDFQRIGVHPRETRLPIIRRAASRVSKSLAARQLNDPSRATEEQLYRVTVSTYRILDPRQRRADRDRAHVGRIRPGVLFHAGQMSVPGRWLMPNETVTEEPADLDYGYQSDPFIGSSTAGELQIHSNTVNHLGFSGETTSDEGGQFQSNSLSEREVLEEIRAVASGQSWLDRPATLIFLIVALFLAALALWVWAQNRRTSVPASLSNIGVIVTEDKH